MWQTLLVSHPESCPPFLLSNWTSYIWVIYKFPSSFKGQVLRTRVSFLAPMGNEEIGLIQSWQFHIFEVIGLDMGLWCNSANTGSLLWDLWKRVTRNSPLAGWFASAHHASNSSSCLRSIWDKSKDRGQHLGYIANATNKKMGETWDFNNVIESTLKPS